LGRFTLAVHVSERLSHVSVKVLGHACYDNREHHSARVTMHDPWRYFHGSRHLVKQLSCHLPKKRKEKKRIALFDFLHLARSLQAHITQRYYWKCTVSDHNKAIINRPFDHFCLFLQSLPPNREQANLILLQTECPHQTTIK